MFTLIAVLGSICGIGYSVLCFWAARSFLRQGKAPSGGFAPPVSILKPLSGVDPRLYENLRSHCLQDYPDFEVIFGVTDPGDAAVPHVQRLMREFPHLSIRLEICSQILGANSKVSKLVQMAPLARHPTLLVNDSDIHVGRDYLRGVLGHFSDPHVGMVTCLYRGIAGRTFGSELEAVAIGTGFAPGVLAARQVEGGIHFALGSTLALRREALQAIGGFDSLLDYLADDFELGRRVAGAGFEVRLSSVIVEHSLPDYSFYGFLRHQLRWARSTRSSRPWGYFGLILTFGLPWALLAAVGSGGAVWGWALLAAAAVFRLATVLQVGVGVLRDRQTARRLWLVPLSDLLALAVWAGGYTGRCVSWRGSEFVLEKGKLRPLVRNRSSRKRLS
ncbi:MAG: bacteriohopanetetrol glucosamine biosynthesis glycosyltransferase HpnI [Acidobacteria bacterium]|nr:bacteriohopanetetrol glucosamine biosynthesis glycosyltransferase HpnI [Acidobacteriota bacterium]